MFPKLPKTSSLSWKSVRCVVEGKGGYLKGNSLTVSETKAVESKTGKTRPNWARKVRELILFNVLCTVYCGRGCLSLESEGKENERLREFLARTTGRDGKPEVF